MKTKEEKFREVFGLLEDVCLRGASAAGLAAALEATGALQLEGAENPVAQYSTRVTDTLPKHWGGAGSAAVPAQLEAKATSHQVLVSTLQQAGVFAQLPASACRAIFEAGEKLHAVAAVREAETRSAAAASTRGTAHSGLLDTAIKAAGLSSTSQVAAELGDRDPWEVFYAAPSVTGTAFLLAVAEGVRHVASEQSLPATQRLEDLTTLAQTLLAALLAGSAQRRWHQSAAPEASNRASGGVSGPDWLTHLPARCALIAVSQAALRLQEQLLDESPAVDATTIAADTADAALSAVAAALTSCEPNDVSGLRMEYAKVQDDLLQPLLAHAVRMMQTGDSIRGQTLLTRLESSSEAHCAMPMLYDICVLLGDQGKLHSFMDRPDFGGDVKSGWSQSFAAYTFDRMEAEGKQSQVLDMPDRFGPVIAEWLALPSASAHRSPLRWLHHLRRQQYAAAAGSLQSIPQEAVESSRRALAIAKLAALASAGDSLAPMPPQDVAAVVGGLNSRLTLLALQDTLGLHDVAPLDAVQLANAALAPGRAPGDAQLALEAFKAAGPEFTAQYEPLLEDIYAKLVSALDLPSREFL